MKKSKKDKRIEISPKEIRVNLEKLQSDVKTAYEKIKKSIPESLTNKKITAFGNASHIILPKEYAGKEATVLIRGKK